MSRNLSTVLFEAIIAKPSDLTARLAYADALEEEGNAGLQQAQLIRAQFAHHALLAELIKVDRRYSLIGKTNMMPSMQTWHRYDEYLVSKSRCDELIQEMWLDDEFPHLIKDENYKASRDCFGKTFTPTRINFGFADEIFVNRRSWFQMNQSNETPITKTRPIRVVWLPEHEFPWYYCNLRIQKENIIVLIDLIGKQFMVPFPWHRNPSTVEQRDEIARDTVAREINAWIVKTWPEIEFKFV